MSVFTKDNKNKIKYEFLIVDDSAIIDYNVYFEKISIKTITTKSHSKYDIKNLKKSKKTDLIQLRKTIINELGFEHKYADENKCYNKPEIINSDSEFLQWVNELFNKYNCNFNVMTFQDIEYVLTGSNASGQGLSKKGYLNVFYNNEIVPFGIFLQGLNYVKEFKKSQYLNKQDRHKENFNIGNIKDLYENYNIPEYSFDNWLNENLNLKRYFDQLLDKNIKWEIVKKMMEKELSNVVHKFANIQRLIIKHRQKLIDRVNKEFNKENKTYYSVYFNIPNKHTDFEIAHIKPVSLIKKEYMENQDENIINQISSLDNFLPLPPTVHSEYDKHYFYWNENGELIEINSNKITMDEINKFRYINLRILNDARRNFLHEYYKKL